MPEKRENFSQLPDSNELRGILDAEVKRELPESKENLHYFEFSPLTALAEHFGVDAEVITKTYAKEDTTSTDLLPQGQKFVSDIKNKILNEKLSDDDFEVLNNAYDYLAEEDIPENADIIFVFGAKTPLRINKAIELFEQGFSKKILVSGKGPFYGNADSKTEAEIYAAIARDKGVSEDAILVEKDSITVPDNVRCSLNLLDETETVFDSIILVNSPYTQRRGWAHFKKYTPDSVELIRVNSGTADQYTREGWFKSSAGIEVVLNEYLKAKIAVSLNTA